MLTTHLKDNIITVLPEPSHVVSVYDTIMGSTTLPETAKNAGSRLFIDCSTIDPITSRGVAAKMKDSNGSAAAFVDAPMSGGAVGAQAAKLTFMLGSAPEHVDRVTEILSKMGARVVHLGLQGAGLSGKLANNYLLALNNIATAEAMSMGIQWGLDPKTLAGMINTATGRCWPSEVNNPVPGVVETAPASRGYEGGFGISLMRKDLGLALASAKEFGIKYGLGDEAMKMYETAEQDERCRGKDFSSMYKWLDGPEPKPKK